MRFLPVFPAALLLSLGAGCGGGDPWAEYNACLDAETKVRTSDVDAAATKGPFSAALIEKDPSEFASMVKGTLASTMRAELERSRAIQIADVRCEHLYPTDALDEVPRTTTGDNGDSRAEQVSSTNNQVPGVDEADFVKNDNEYIYIVSGSTFRIIDAWPAAGAHEVAKVTVPGEAKKLFVEGDRALVYSSTPGQDQSARDGNRDCTYGYDGCVPTGDGTETEISVFDISDRASPKLLRSVHSSSSFIAARRVGGTVHTVLSQPVRGADWASYPTTLPSHPTEEQINQAYDALIAENEALIDEVDADAILPSWQDSQGAPLDLNVFQASIPDGHALTSLLSVDLSASAPLEVTSILSRPGWVYASSDALYVAVPHRSRVGWGWYDAQSVDELSTIHKFSMSDTPVGTRYTASGIVKGRVLNQLAMDDSAGFLRVATMSGQTPDPEAHSTISVMEDKGGRLEPIAQIDQIAKGEDLRSVRFDGDRGYIVTFKNTDPLFVFDLSDPRAPRPVGALEIPGFSTYMHMMDATHLLTIGYDANDESPLVTGVLLQIFDVTDPATPKLSHKETIGTGGTTSEVLMNPLAFNYFAPKELLALPMTVCDGGDKMTFSGLMVYDVTAADGFTLKGKVAHPNGYSYGANACNSWWANATTAVKRSILMDDWVYSVSDTRIKVNNLESLGTDVAEISLE